MPNLKMNFLLTVLYKSTTVLNQVLKVFFCYCLITISLLSCEYRIDQTNLAKNPDLAENRSKDTKNQVEKKFVTIIAAGDIMMGTTYPSSLLPPNDGKEILDSVKSYLRGGDIVIGNLEGPLLDKGGHPKRCIDKFGNLSRNCHSFRVPERYGAYLKNAGFNYMCLANNHANDMGTPGKKSTMRVLDSLGIKYSGLLTNPIAIIEKEELKIGVAAFSPNNGTVSINDHRNAKKIVSELKKSCNIVIVTFHGGGEGTSFQNVKDRQEYYLNENRGNVYRFSRDVIDAGADLVIGHGPHVTRSLDYYKGKLIAYSLGNFCTYGKFGLGGEFGIAPILQVKLTSSGEFVSGNIVPIKQINRGFPVPDDKKRAIKTLQRLLKQDFPESNLVIRDNGELTVTAQ